MGISKPLFLYRHVNFCKEQVNQYLEGITLATMINCKKDHTQTSYTRINIINSLYLNISKFVIKKKPSYCSK